MAFITRYYSSVNDSFFQALKQSLDGCRSTRKCPGLSDFELLRLSVNRSLSQARSGRDFLQQAREIADSKTGRSNFFEAIKSTRCAQVALRPGSQWGTLPDVEPRTPRCSGSFGELKDFELYAGDGHFHAAGSKSRSAYPTT